MDARLPAPDAPLDADRTPLLERAVGLALRAPSLHNTQPWRWRITPTRIELHADRVRGLHDTDPDHRDLLISCGAALHHLHVAFAGLGTAVETERFPDRDDQDHLATIRLASGRPDRSEAMLFSSIGRRHTDRRPYRPDPVASATLDALGAQAARHGATLLPVVRDDVRLAIDALLGEAADVQRHRPGYLAELMTWTRRYADSHDGVPLSARPGRFTRSPSDPLRRFPPGQLVGPAADTADGGILVVVTTAGDDERSRLTAGEATSAVLLAATRAGLATAPLSQALELPTTRRRLALRVLDTPDHPQMIVRLGRPPDDRELPGSPRRPLSAVRMGPSSRPGDGPGRPA